MDESQLVNGLNRQNALSHVEFRDILGKGVIFDQPRSQEVISISIITFRYEKNVHGHQITTRQKLHDEVQVIRILERIE